MFIRSEAPPQNRTTPYAILPVPISKTIDIRSSKVQQIPLQEATQNLPSLIAAAVRGEIVLITTEDQQVIRLVPMKQPKQPRQFGSAKGLIQMADDFDAPLDDFREYMP